MLRRPRESIKEGGGKESGVEIEASFVLAGESQDVDPRQLTWRARTTDPQKPPLPSLGQGDEAWQRSWGPPLHPWIGDAAGGFPGA